MDLINVINQHTQNQQNHLDAQARNLESSSRFPHPIHYEVLFILPRWMWLRYIHSSLLSELAALIQDTFKYHEHSGCSFLILPGQSTLHTIIKVIAVKYKWGKSLLCWKPSVIFHQPKKEELFMLCHLLSL